MDATLRLDMFLWHVRLAKTRSVAASIASAGHIRIDGRSIARACAPVRIGNVLTVPIYDRVRVIRVDALPVRRGPPAEARACYTDLTVAPAASSIPSHATRRAPE